MITNIFFNLQQKSSNHKYVKMKNIISIFFLLILNINYAQNYGSPEYQKTRIDEAMYCIKNNELERATSILYSVNKINSKNELGKLALKKADSLLPIVQQKIIRNLIGTWTLFESGSNWGFKTEKDTLIKKVLIITDKNFQFYEQNLKTKENKLIKTEKTTFTKYEDMSDNQFDFVFTDKSIWAFFINKETNVLRQINTGEETDEGRTEIVCGNSELNYKKD
ncbi:hypothetical protein FLA105534_02943 [Flavobacterium bizetiae]|uniref:Uncharacterized protein n=2 Tax=Flavobacterium bizetiae TaxID=2704140 RepID=A0A6J4GME8_9FLAO|nr:hypothetical protein FLA105534_02943 [Flavobacterium bizetiae]CAD5343476.1 hypothetical protein FLA105535_03474 [Flavobacterium bizetiae]CAD5349469.1 hypothetical protein FLA105534_03453 [Flavobacterium bizetiae]